ncbi:hypothetical protein LTR09_004397 [Extremus antarcticus]|uniref:Peptidase A1 domain-containing protein n=1 Tax=Extremus antarcticus TaxID=702011 RepID=A0AAJ0DIF9_9PEZI|nr:hypothetical protein LTR09_004397 [Extremus antarcticus]
MPSLLNQLRLLPTSLLALTISYALAADGGSNNDLKPISISPSQQWDGIDGAWSSFAVRLGTPYQDIRTFVSWNAYQTWAVIPEGCEAAADYDACAQARGGIFNQSASMSWHEQGLYSLRILEELGYNGNGYYGFDVAELSDKGPTVQNSTVVGFALEDFYLGVLGINPKPTNFSDDTSGSQSYMTLLKQQDHIPSISFGYTAGAQYRADNAYGSLTLGGYDESKIIANDITWKFGTDPFRDIVVALQSVHTPSNVESSPVATELLPDPINVYLDATVPQIWLPIESCFVFEYEFGLVYDNTTELYLVNNTLHQTLLSRNASITFQLAVSGEGGNVASIELPYAAFDLTAKAPYQGVQNDTLYFPLRRASNESQYTLGRAFFQEAYIAVDYESQQFNVSQRNWDSSSDQRLVTIPAYSARSSYPGVASMEMSSSGGLTGGAIAGIVVGVIALLVLLGLLALFLFRRRSKAAKQRELENEKLGSASETGSDHGGSTPGRGTESIVIQKAELQGSEPRSQHDSDDHGLPASGALSSNDSSSPSDTRSHRTPNALSGQTFINGRWNGEAYSPVTEPEEGTGTHSSTDSSSRGTGTASRTSNYGTGSGTLASLVSPLSPVDSHEGLTRHEADGKERHVYEMAGSMPTVKEKDGHEMSEKEALAHREKVYNGVENPPSPTEVRTMSHAATSREAPKRVNPDEVVRANTAVVGGQGIGTRELSQEERDFGLHRQFSFEGQKKDEREGTEELYK